MTVQPPNECCRDLANREDGPGPRGAENVPAEVTITHCRVCECRHFEANLDQAQFGLEGTRL